MEVDATPRDCVFVLKGSVDPLAGKAVSVTLARGFFAEYTDDCIMVVHPLSLTINIDPSHAPTRCLHYTARAY